MATTDATPQAIAARPADGRGAPAAVRLAVKGGAVLVAAFATMFSVTYFIPEGNDYARASVLKHDRLAAIDARKIVLVGGSNLSFGINSALIEERTGCPAVNMGMNGYFGVRFILNEVKPELNRGDVVVIAFEYDNYFKSVDGTPSDLLAVAKSNPGVIDALTWRQQLAVLKAAPYVAQQKILRLAGQAYDSIAGRGGNGPAVDIIDIESFKSFAPNGDLVGHLGMAWPYALENGLDATNLPLEQDAIDLMQGFAADMQQRGVHVMVSYTPVMRDYYEAHAAALDHIHDAVLAAPPLVAPSPPAAYVYERPMFFDTVYHLNAEGRAARTERLIEDLSRELQAAASCFSETAVAQH
jgi:hypothetical protein